MTQYFETRVFEYVFSRLFALRIYRILGNNVSLRVLAEGVGIKVLLQLDQTENKVISNSNKITTYTFNWLTASTPEEEIFKNLQDLIAGRVDIKTLNQRHKERIGRAHV
mgnify:FL=1